MTNRPWQRGNGRVESRAYPASYQAPAEGESAGEIIEGDPGLDYGPADFGPGDYDLPWMGWSQGPPRGFWGRAEYIAWWVRGSNTPPLVTTSPDGTQPGVAGVLPPNGNAQILFGNQRINTEGRSGGRFTVGYWFHDGDTASVEDTFFFLGNANQGFHSTSGGSPILARPFFNTFTNTQDAILIAAPNVVIGSINVTSYSTLLGNEVNLRRALFIDCYRRLDLLAGYRYFHLNENLRVGTDTTSTLVSTDPTVPPVGTTFNVFDSFTAVSNFNGGQLGLNAKYFGARWTVDVVGKIALGGMSQRVVIDGATTVTFPPPNNTPVTNQGGLLALNSNIGSYQRNQFAAIPEFDVNLAYQLTPLWKVNVGYSLIVVTNVVRPGDQIDFNVDSRRLPPPDTTHGTPTPNPAFAFHDSDLWLQGINVGLECNF